MVSNRIEDNMKKGRKILSNMPLRVVITVMLLPFFLLIIFCCVLFYTSGVNYYATLVRENVQDVVEQTRESLNQDLNDIEDKSQGLVSQQIFFSMKKNISEGKTSMTPVDYLQLSTKFTDYLLHYSTYADSIGLFLKDNTIYYYQSNTGSTTEKPRNFDMEKLQECSGNLEWIYNADYVRDSENSNLSSEVSLMEVLKDSNGSVSGFFCICFRRDTFENQVKNTRLTLSSNIAVIRTNGTILSNISSDQSESIFDKFNEAEQQEIKQKISKVEQGTFVSFEKGNYCIAYTPISIQGAGILAVIPLNEMNISYHNFVKVYLIFVIASIAIFFALYFYIPRYFSNPITSLIGQMNKIYTLKEREEIHVYGALEIIQIEQGINSLLNRIQSLNESMELEMKAKQATQLQYLFAQINPHFLYNTLDCIKELNACNKYHDAEKMLDQLAIFYRIGVSKGKSFIPLKEEMKHVDVYLAILQTRFEDFQYSVELPEELNQCYVLRMILQPIAENAVGHGLRPTRLDGNIKIYVERYNNQIKIHVKDDGGGISEDVLEQIQKSLAEPICEYTEKSYGVYGLKNVQDRIQIAYGSEYGIQIETSIDCGTEVTITMPFEEKTDDENIICR